MKKLSKISLHNLSQAELVKREQNQLKGGLMCTCGCYCGYNCSCSYNFLREEEKKGNYYGASGINDNASATGSNIEDGFVTTIAEAAVYW